MGPSPCRDWSRISFKNAPRREGESLHSAKKMRGISAGKSSSNNKTNSSSGSGSGSGSGTGGGSTSGAGIRQ